MYASDIIEKLQACITLYGDLAVTDGEDHEITNVIYDPDTKAIAIEP